MSGFSADWLELRESADQRTRNVALRDELAHAFSDRRDIAVVDLGCGAGSNIRALAPYLPEKQDWWLVDHDPALLIAARRSLIEWADRVEDEAPLVVVKAGRRIAVEFRETDLSRSAAQAIGAGVDLVTAAAFFDLVSPQWIAGFADDLARSGAALHAALTYDGQESWTPTHPADAAMLAAFHAHQRRDKGFGPAAGPDAAHLLRLALEARGYATATGPSTWRLGPADKSLIEALAAGAAQAVRETGLVEEAIIDSWTRSARMACEIGHLDLFARKPLLHSH